VTSLDEEVPMPLWTLVHSVRYAMGRNTFANCDAARLLKRYWNHLPDFLHDQFREDYLRIDWDGPMKVSSDKMCWGFMWGGKTPEETMRWVKVKIIDDTPGDELWLEELVDEEEE